MEKRVRPGYLIFLTVCILFFPVSHAAESVPVGQTEDSSPPIPAGQPQGTPVGESGIGADVFGQEGGVWHPFLIVEERWTDNLFITESNKKDDLVTTVAPGLWLAFPANREKLLSINTRTTSPGGLQVSRVKPEAARRFQTYALYSPELVLYANNSRHDHFNHNAEAMFQYNLNNGLSFDVIDVFKDREEISGDGITDTLYRYKSNLVDFITAYQPSDRLKLRLDYSNFLLDYNEAVNDYRDRMDNSFSLYAFYRFWPKTSLFVEYEHADIEFDQSGAYDSRENRYYAGIDWAATAKTRGSFKLGYMDKDFDSVGIEDQDGFSFELQAQHNLSAKRGLLVSAFRKFNESNTSGASSFFATGIDIGLMHRFNEKWSGTLNALAERDDYNGIDREDDFFSIGPSFRYKPRDWLIFDFSYFLSMNDSSIQIYDYTSHEILLRATISM